MEFEEMAGYLTLMYDDVYYKSINQYLEICESFVDNKIDAKEFISKFYDIRNENIRTGRALKENFEPTLNLALHPKSPGFCEMISDIYFLIDLFDSSLDSNSESMFPYAISREELRKFIEGFILKIRKYY